MLAGWIVATIACTATMIGTANVTVILLRRTSLSKGVRKLLAMGIGQVATAAVGVLLSDKQRVWQTVYLTSKPKPRARLGHSHRGSLSDSGYLQQGIGQDIGRV